MKLEVYVSKLPKHCFCCPCSDGYCFCSLVKDAEIPDYGRLPDCPLKEISELINEKDI